MTIEKQVLANDSGRSQKVTISQCGRCDQAHVNIIFVPLVESVEIDGEIYNWGTLCPTTNQVILMRVEDK